MAITFGKTEVERMAEVLDADYESLDAAAKAALELAVELMQKRGKYALVGQLAGDAERDKIPPSDPEAVKVHLGLFSTEGNAQSAAESLWRNLGTGERFNVWILDVHHGTPAEFHKSRRGEIEKLEEKRRQAQRDKMKASIEKRQREINERAEEWRTG